MKKIFVTFFWMLCTIIVWQNCFSSTGSFFTTSSNGSRLSLSTINTGRTYPLAGIKLSSSAASLTFSGTECTPYDNGFCLLTLSDSTTSVMTITGRNGRIDYILCLNAKSPLTCQNIQNTIANRLYMAEFADNEPRFCTINNDNTLGACSNAFTGGITPVQPKQIAFNPQATRVYISTKDNDADDSVLTCPVNQNGTFGDCVDSGNTGVSFDIPRGIVVNSAGTRAYVANSVLGPGNFVLMCPINQNTGLFDACVDSGNTGVGFSGARGILLNKAQNRAYVANYDNSTVSICPVNTSTGLFGDCADSGNTGLAFDNPEQIAINNDETFAYIINAGFGGGQSFVSVCPIDQNTGLFGACVDSGATNVPVGESLRGIALNRVGTVAFIAQLPGVEGNIFSCPVLTNGLLGACVDTGISGQTSYLSIQ